MGVRSEQEGEAGERESRDRRGKGGAGGQGGACSLDYESLTAHVSTPPPGAQSSPSVRISARRASRDTGTMTMTETATDHRRADAGTVRLGQREIDVLILVAEHGVARYDLLAAAVGAQ